MANWQAWTAALGGLVALVGEWAMAAGSGHQWTVTVGALAALVFGVWAAYAE